MDELDVIAGRDVKIPPKRYSVNGRAFRCNSEASKGHAALFGIDSNLSQQKIPAKATPRLHTLHQSLRPTGLASHKERQPTRKKGLSVIHHMTPACNTVIVPMKAPDSVKSRRIANASAQNVKPVDEGSSGRRRLGDYLSKSLSVLAGLALSLLLATATSHARATFSPPPNLDRLVQSHLQTEALRRQQIAQEGGDVRRAAVIDAMYYLYSLRGFKPIWTTLSKQRDLLLALDGASDEGLNPDTYGMNRLSQVLKPTSISSYGRIRRDLEATESLLTYYYHLAHGKIDPALLEAAIMDRPDTDFREKMPGLSGAIDLNQVRFYSENFAPRHENYQRLRAHLKKLRAVQALGGWPSVHSKKTLAVGAESPAVADLRHRLFISGDFQDIPTESEVFEPALAEAVRNFQRRHNLKPDGLVGRGTLRAMNMPIPERIERVRANLERMRWVFRELDNEFVLVDIAGFAVHLYQNGKKTWSGKAQVGKPYRATPVVRSKITYLEWNPTWTVPITVFKEDMQKKIVEDPDYLARNGYQVLDLKNQPLDVAEINWEEEIGDYLPFRIVQAPGPKNALGRVKFIFPNPHYVYLHDTPAKGLFDRRSRAFSSGCIRIDKPFELAEKIMAVGSQRRDYRGTMNEILESEETSREYLRRPVPVILMYSTVQAMENGQIRFLNDIYERDQILLGALDDQIAPSELPLLIAKHP